MQASRQEGGRSLAVHAPVCGVNRVSQNLNCAPDVGIGGLRRKMTNTNGSTSMAVSADDWIVLEM